MAVGTMISANKPYAGLLSRFLTHLPADAEVLRPRARGPLIDRSRQRPQGPIAGCIGLNSETRERLRAVWQDHDLRLLDAPGLLAESFACRAQGQILEADDWARILAEDRLDSVSGAFALAWHTGERLQLIRDAVGERTLFYAPYQQGLIFASTLELLLLPDLIPRRLNHEVMARYLAYAYVPGRESLIQGVYELEPGECVSFGPDGLTQQSWWDFAPNRWESPDAGPRLIQELRESIETAVRNRMPTQGPLCASLSGGIDSSLVVALLHRFSREELITFTVSFGAKYRNELPFSRHVAEQAGARNIILEASPRTVLHHLDETVALMGNPVGDPLTVPNALIFREASRYSGVLFNGEGGDPNFGGPKNIPMLLSELYGDPYHERLNETTYLRERTYLRSYRKLYEDLPQLLNAHTQAQIPADALERQLAPWLDPDIGESFVQKLMVLNTRFKGAHHILFKVNALSRAFGIEPASPLFDKDVTALAIHSPPQLKLNGTIEKFILKEAIGDLLSPRILNRPKSGMQVPVELWFRPGGPLHREARRRIRRLEDYDLFEPDYLRRLMRWELGGFLPRHGPKVWILLTLESWLRRYIAGG